MNKHKFAIGIFLAVLLGLAVFVFVNTIPETKEETGMAAQNEDTARIPQLKEGVNVHELENEIFSVLGPESVAISTERSSGSGILWKYDGRKMIVITTSHLMQDFESGELELWTGEKVSFSKENVLKSEETDMAVIIISCEKKFKLDQGGAQKHLVEETPKIGDTLWIIDSVYGAASGIGTCSVASELVFLEDYGTEMLLLYGEGKNGMSGSPIYDEKGSLVAMMSGMSEDGTTLAAVPAGEIMRFLEGLRNL